MKIKLVIVVLVLLVIAISIVAYLFFSSVFQNSTPPIVIPEDAHFNQAVYDDCMENIDMLYGFVVDNCSYERGKLVVLFNDHSEMDERLSFLESIGAKSVYDAHNELPIDPYQALLQETAAAVITNVPRRQEKEYACRIMAMENPVVSKVYGSVSCTMVGL